MAPELLRGEGTNNSATDIYSFGIILYEVYSRKDPYEGEDPDEVLSLVRKRDVRKRPPVPRNMPTSMESIMHDCLEDEIDKRPNCEELDVRVHRVAIEPSATDVNKTTLDDIFPRHVAEALRAGRTVEPGKHATISLQFRS